MSKLALALVLCDVVAHGLKAGQILEASPVLVKQLEKDGSVDPAKAAVAFAQRAGADVVRSGIELAQEQRDASVDALRIELAKLDDLKAKAADEATAAALGRQSADLRAQLAALGQTVAEPTNNPPA